MLTILIHFTIHSLKVYPLFGLKFLLLLAYSKAPVKRERETVKGWGDQGSWFIADLKLVGFMEDNDVKTLHRLQVVRTR